jgi:hypothetical protein
LTVEIWLDSANVIGINSEHDLKGGWQKQRARFAVGLVIKGNSMTSKYVPDAKTYDKPQSPEILHGLMVESLMGAQGEPTKYTAPEEQQKLRAMKLFSFQWRHLGLDIPAGHREALLCVIDHANAGFAGTGRSDTRQRIMAVETGLSRKAINEGLNWWAKNTGFLKIEKRSGKSNAYHVQWKAIDDAYAEAKAKIRNELSTGGCNL